MRQLLYGVCSKMQPLMSNILREDTKRVGNGTVNVIWSSHSLTAGPIVDVGLVSGWCGQSRRALKHQFSTTVSQHIACTMCCH
jgi:hypothetical protein